MSVRANADEAAVAKATAELKKRFNALKAAIFKAIEAYILSKFCMVWRSGKETKLTKKMVSAYCSE